MSSLEKSPSTAGAAAIQRLSSEEIYASGDAAAACRAARAVLADSSASSDDKARAQAFLSNIAIDRMTKAVAGVSLAVVLSIIAALYIFS